MDQYLDDFHLSLQVLDHLDAGIVMIDRQYSVCSWNGFMQAYSGIQPEKILGKNLFSVLPHLPIEWLTNQIESTFRLQMRTFSSWEERSRVFDFHDFCPISGSLELMHQNVTFMPLKCLNGDYTHIAIVVTDVSSIAKSKNHLRQSNEELSYLSKMDKLTELYNRGHWERCLSEQFEASKKTGQPAVLVLLDIDFFKKINDKYGHLAGDKTLREMAKVLQHNKRKTDISGRYGGEEFGIILPNATLKNSQIFTERLRHAIEQAPMAYRGKSWKITVSLGVAEWHEKLTSYEQWLRHADKALYQSKSQGRNRVTLYNEMIKSVSDS